MQQCLCGRGASNQAMATWIFVKHLGICKGVILTSISNIMMIKFVTTGRHVISQHVHNTTTNPMEVVNVRDGIKSVEDFIDRCQ